MTATAAPPIASSSRRARRLPICTCSPTSAAHPRTRCALTSANCTDLPRGSPNSAVSAEQLRVDQIEHTHIRALPGHAL